MGGSLKLKRNAVASGGRQRAGDSRPEKLPRVILVYDLHNF